MRIVFLNLLVYLNDMLMKNVKAAKYMGHLDETFHILRKTQFGKFWSFPSASLMELMLRKMEFGSHTFGERKFW